MTDEAPPSQPSPPTGILEKAESFRRGAISAKYEAEEQAESERLGFPSPVSEVRSCIPDSLLDDFKQLCKGSVPIHVEVIMRITISSFLAFVLALGDFPNVVPQSQRVLIAMLGSMLGMLFPSLLFSVGSIMFPPMIFVTLLGLVLATMLLACAAGVGLGFYTFMFGLNALMLSGMRFEKTTGAMTVLLIIEMGLNSQPLAAVAEDFGTCKNHSSFLLSLRRLASSM